MLRDLLDYLNNEPDLPREMMKFSARLTIGFLLGVALAAGVYWLIR